MGICPAIPGHGVRQDEDMLITIDTAKTLPKGSAVTPLRYVE
jgi:hypothetical protein